MDTIAPMTLTTAEAINNQKPRSTAAGRAGSVACGAGWPLLYAP